MSFRAALPASALVPLRLQGASLATKAVLVAVGTLVLTASSWIEIPMIPVPMNMQTFAVLLLGALCGWRLGAATIIAWFAEAAIGLPVLSGGASGLAHFTGPTSGYLFAFLVAATLIGWLAERGWTSDILRSTATLLLGHALILALGAAWLSVLFG
ncbi:MAG TPA: biotin transporter BioY, partial [Inquilinus sp.]|nr:biotin transporter BioY [Inquilinus sp.]